MSSATDPRWGFEGPGVLEALLSEAGQPKPIEEVDRLLRAALKESLLPSEIVYRVVGKHARVLPTPLVRRLASNLFALYASIGREVFEKTQTELLAHAVRLQGLSEKARLDFLSRVTKAREPAPDSAGLEEISPDSAGSEALKNMREAEEALFALCQDLRARPSTRRLCMDAQSALSHLALVIEGAAKVLKDETLLGSDEPGGGN